MPSTHNNGNASPAADDEAAPIIRDFGASTAFDKTSFYDRFILQASEDVPPSSEVPMDSRTADWLDKYLTCRTETERLEMIRRRTSEMARAVTSKLDSASLERNDSFALPPVVVSDNHPQPRKAVRFSLPSEDESRTVQDSIIVSTRNSILKRGLEAFLESVKNDGDRASAKRPKTTDTREPIPIALELDAFGRVNFHDMWIAGQPKLPHQIFKYGGTFQICFCGRHGIAFVAQNDWTVPAMALQHLMTVPHDFIDQDAVNEEDVVEYFGHEVVNCDDAKAEAYNTALRLGGAFAHATGQRYETRPMAENTATISSAIATAMVLGGLAYLRTHDKSAGNLKSILKPAVQTPHPQTDVTVAAPIAAPLGVGRPFVPIIGGLIRAFKDTNNDTRGWYCAVRLPSAHFDGVLASGHLEDTGLLSPSKLPDCYELTQNPDRPFGLADPFQLEPTYLEGELPSYPCFLFHEDQEIPQHGALDLFEIEDKKRGYAWIKSSHVRPFDSSEPDDVTEKELLARDVALAFDERRQEIQKTQRRYKY